MNSIELLSNTTLERQAIAWILSGSEHFRERYRQASKSAGVFNDPGCIGMLAELRELYRSEKEENDRQLRFWGKSLPVRLQELAKGWECESCDLDEQRGFETVVGLLLDLARRREWMALLEQSKAKSLTLNRDLGAILDEMLIHAMSLRKRWFSSPSSFQKGPSSSGEESNSVKASPAKKSASSQEMRDAMCNMIEEAERIYTARGEPLGVPSGFRSLDLMTTGFQPGKLYLVIGMPGEGRTALMLTMARAALQRKGVVVGISASKENQTDLLRPLFYQHAEVDICRIAEGLMADSDFQRMTQSASALCERLEIQCHSARAMDDVQAQAERLSQFEGERILFVDDIHCLDADINAVCEEVKALARLNEIPIVAFAMGQHASVDGEEWKESGATSDLEDGQEVQAELFTMDVDGLMLLERTGECFELGLVRNVGRPAGVIPLIFDYHWLRFTEVSDQEEEGKPADDENGE